MNNLFLRNRLCIPVYGCNRGIIYDLTRSDYHFVPKLLAEHINTLETINFQFVKGIDDLTHWIGFLKEKEIIFEIDSKDEAKLFPPVCTAYHSPFDLTTLLIHDELDATVLEYFTSVYLPNISVIITDFTKVRLTTLLCILDYMEIDSIN